MRYLKTMSLAIAMLSATACDDDNGIEPNPGMWLGFQDATIHGNFGANPAALAVADINADTRADIITLDTVLDGARIAVGGAAGGYTHIGSITFGAGTTDLRVADVSRDHVPDILGIGSAELRVSRGGAGGPGAVTSYPLAGASRAIAIGDMDNDNKPDVSVVYEATANRLGVSVHITRPADGALVTAIDYTSVTTAAGVRACVFDVTGEGEADVVIATRSAATPLVLLPNRGGVTFEAPLAYGNGTLNAHADAKLACADFNGDGMVDVILLEPGANATLAWFAGSQAGLQHVRTESIGAASDLAAMDADADGRADLVVARPQENGVDLWRNDGQGDFEQPALILTGGSARYIAVADVNRDGFLDMVLANDNGTVSVVKNAGR